MIMVILLFYLVNSLMTPTTHGAIDFKSKKPIMCFYSGFTYLRGNPKPIPMDPLDMPEECELIVYNYFEITCTGKIASDTNVIKKLTSLNKPVYLEVYRKNRYVDWISILGADGNAADAKAITDFAVANKIQGVILWNISPVLTTDVVDPNVGKNIIPYLKQLKVNPDFGVGILIQPWDLKLMVDPSVYNYEELNNVLDLYVVNTVLSDPCNPDIDTITPNHATGSGFGLDLADKDLRTTPISTDKIYFIISMAVVLPQKQATSYGEVCKGKVDCKTWCIPTTKGYYEQAKFIKSLNYGISTTWLEYDDINSTCGCCPYVGFKNMVAGYNGAPHIPCEKFDFKLTCLP